MKIYMTKITIAISTLILILITFKAEAQIGGFLKSIDEVEIIGGLSSVSIRGSDEVGEGRQSMLRPYIGVNLKFTFSDQISLLSGLDYNIKGGRQIIDVTYYDEPSNTEKKGQVEYINEFRYLAIPINIRYNFLKKRILFIECGGYYGILFRESTTRVELFSGYKQTSVRTEMYKNDFGIQGGIGLNLPVRNRLSALFKMTYCMGLADISNFYPPMFTHHVIKTNSTSFLAGINLKL
jgi:hypothetical protein